MKRFARLATPQHSAARRALRTLGSTVALAVAAFAMSGCLTAWTTYDFQADGSGSRHMIAAMDPNLVELAQASAEESGEELPQDIFEPLRNSPGLPADAVVVDYEDPTTGRRGVEITFGFGSAEELADLSANGAIPESEQVSITRDGDVTTFSIVFDPQSSDEMGTAELTPQERRQIESLWQMLGFDVGYSVIVPGTLVDWGPQEIGEVSTTEDGRTQVTWYLNDYSALTETTELWVSWQG